MIRRSLITLATFRSLSSLARDGVFFLSDGDLGNWMYITGAETVARGINRIFFICKGRTFYEIYLSISSLDIPYPI